MDILDWIAVVLTETGHRFVTVSINSSDDQR